MERLEQCWAPGDTRTSTSAAPQPRCAKRWMGLPSAQKKAVMPSEFKGQCCGGTKQWGSGKGRLCTLGCHIYYVCHGCGKELPKCQNQSPPANFSQVSPPQLTAEQRERIEKNKLAAMAKRAAAAS